MTERIFLAGHRGMVGSAIHRALCHRKPDAEILTADRKDLDLRDQAAVAHYLKAEQPDSVILAAAKVGGISANATYPADFLHDNLQIQSNVIGGANDAGVERLLFLGSSCIYPKAAAQPLVEESLLTGPLEPTNEPYAIAKIAGIKLCEAMNRQFGRDYRSVMPTNLYGPGDNFHPQNSHVLPALLRRFHEALREGQDAVAIWGTGTPRREFLHVDDMADACLFVHDLPKEDLDTEVEETRSHLNVGTGEDLSILELAKKVARITGFSGQIVTDPSKPDGTPVKRLDVSRLARLGWKAKIGLDDGLQGTYDWFVANQSSLRG